MSRLADIYKQEVKGGGGVSSALGKRLAEKIDPRQIFDRSGLIATMFPALKSYSAIKSTPSLDKSPLAKMTPPSMDTGAPPSMDTGVLADVSAATKLSAKNSMVLPAMARDMNLMRQNIAKIVKLQGGTSATKADMFFKRAGERESLFESAFSKIRGKGGSVSVPIGAALQKRDGQSKSTALYVETVGLSDALLGALGGKIGGAAASAGGKLSGALAKVLPFLASATLPILGVAGLAGLLYFLIKKDSGEAQTVDEMQEGGGYTPEQGGRAAAEVPQASEEELRKARESMRTSEDPTVRAAAAELDRRDAVRALPDESEAERRRLGLSEFTPIPATAPVTPTPEVVPSNVVVSGSGEAIRTGSGGFVTSGEPSFPVVSPTPAAPPASTTPSKVAAPVGTGPSDDLINFLKQKENPKLAREKGTSKAFWDFKQYSIGYGTKASGPDEIITESEADRRLRDELSKSYQHVTNFAKQKGYSWDQGKLDALTSFVYNLGPGALKTLTADGKRTDEEIARMLPQYNQAGGKVQPGLVARRGSELAMFTGGAGATGGAGPVMASLQTPKQPAQASSTTASAVPSSPSRGATVAAVSTAVADGQRTSSGGGSVMIDNSQRNTVASPTPTGKPASAYDKDIVDALVSAVYA